MKRLLPIGMVLIIIVLTSGCSKQMSWVYKPNSYSVSDVKTQKNTVILPFADDRPNNNSNCFMVYMVPLAPYGWGNYDAPENAQMHFSSGLWVNYEPTEDFAKALASELESANYFNEVYFDYKKGSSDYYIKGKIINTNYNGKLYSYGLSVYGPALWLIGLPAGTVTNDLTVELSFNDSKTKQPLFTKSYTAPTYKQTSWIYSLQSDFNYSELLKTIYNDFCNDLKAHLTSIN